MRVNISNLIYIEIYYVSKNPVHYKKLIALKKYKDELLFFFYKILFSISWEGLSQGQYGKTKR